MGLSQNVLSNNICLYKFAHKSGPRGFPDMSLSAFCVKFNEKKVEVPPRACRPQKVKKKNNVQDMGLKNKKNNVHKKGSPPARPPEPGSAGRSPPGCRGLGAQLPRCSGPGGRSPPGCKGFGAHAPRCGGSGGQRPPGNNIYIYIFINISIYIYKCILIYMYI